MLNVKYLLLLSLFSMAHAADSDITKFMKHLEVIPDLITEGPKDFLNVNYDSGVVADKGVELTPTQVKHQPKVEWTSESADTYYTLIMTDPDAPSRAKPEMREWHHWLVVNIPGNALDKGEVLSEYIGSGAPKDTGLHRYVFLLYKQPKKLEFSEIHLTNTSAKGREKFSTKNFADKYGLGIPVAGNFFQAQYDEYVPELYKQLGF
ncbi:protein D3 [Zeugodacus cucurbitae]|uniref:Phosphatidylethanolamine-binding protein homolog F40A3.3 n=1 Tax=Zeugodacus cucurbitae TaxID=28588 RepID=A0A0A1X1L0_ZEUCU|nr:protein D3 [Zeugodacus cucurbitae]